MITPKFEVLQAVNIIELDRPGLVLAIFIDSGGIQYHVRYFQNGEAKTVYFYGFELEARS